MMTNGIRLIMAARCEAAGRPSNEDNFQLTDNLSVEQWGFMTDNEVALNKKGAIMIVCDGMGGMNAGEVASQLAVETIKKWFSPDRLTSEVTANAASIKKHIENAVVAADAQIKSEGKKDVNKEGMGSTVVLAWIIGQSAYIGWCGDSRAYCFNPAHGLKRLSHDHSYVQSLVDSGKLSEELAFDHPESNIITRSLGDPRHEAKPDVIEYPLCNGDIIMLCSDGLCGILRDNEIEAVMMENTGSMATCRDALWEAARKAGWHDNVTIGLCRILSGSKHVNLNVTADILPRRPKRIFTFMMGLITGWIVIFIAVFAYWYFQGCEPEPNLNMDSSAVVMIRKDFFLRKDTVLIQIMNPNDPAQIWTQNKPLWKGDGNKKYITIVPK